QNDRKFLSNIRVASVDSDVHLVFNSANAGHAIDRPPLSGPGGCSDNLAPFLDFKCNLSAEFLWGAPRLYRSQGQRCAPLYPAISWPSGANVSSVARNLNLPLTPTARRESICGPQC